MKTNSVSSTVINLFFTIVSICVVIPLLLVISISMSNERDLILYGYRFIPLQFDFSGYEIIFKSPWVLINAYGVTIFVTVVGTICALALTAMMGYVISRRDYRYNRITTFYIFVTMLFGGGLVPFYILMTQYLYLKNTIWALIIPYLLNPFYIILMKGFLSKVPLEIIESAKIDGASELRIFFRMIIPISTPALATIGLFLSFMFWNDWWLALLFIESPKMVPLQLLMNRMINNVEFLKARMAEMALPMINMHDFPSLSARMAMVVLAAGPMMFIFPFFQRYFVKGLTVGSLK